MNSHHAFEGDQQVPFVEFPYEEVNMAAEKSDKEKAKVQVLLDQLVKERAEALVNEQVKELTLRTLDWLILPVDGARMRPEKMILAKTHVLLLNLCPGATLTEVASTILMPTQKLSIINDDYRAHFGQPSIVSKSAQARAALARRFANLPPVGGVNPQLDLLTGNPIED